MESRAEKAALDGCHFDRSVFSFFRNRVMTELSPSQKFLVLGTKMVPGLTTQEIKLALILTHVTSFKKKKSLGVEVYIAGFNINLRVVVVVVQHCDEQRRIEGAHQAAEDPCGHLQQHPDGPAAQTLPAALRVLRLRVTQEHELLRAQQHAGLQHHHPGPGAGTETGTRPPDVLYSIPTAEVAL